MSTSQDAPSEREQIEMLLPWFVTDRLDAADKARVEAHLARDPSLLSQLDLVRDEQFANIAANEVIPAPRSLSVERGMAAVAARTSLGVRQAGEGLLSRVREFFTLPTPQAVRYATAAAVVVVLLQAAAIGSLMISRDGYITASGGPAGEGTTAIVRFVDGASVDAIAAALGKLNMVIIDGPKPGGTFVVRLAPKSLSKIEREARIAELRKASGVVGLVLP